LLLSSSCLTYSHELPAERVDPNWCDPIYVVPDGLAHSYPEWWNPNFYFTSNNNTAYEIRVYPTSTSKSSSQTTKLGISAAVVCPDLSHYSSFVNTKTPNNKISVLRGKFTTNGTISQVGMVVYNPSSTFAVRVCPGGCNKDLCADDNCSGNGLCDPFEGTCVCSSGWTGTKCELRLTTPKSCPNNCYAQWGQGSCDTKTGYCTCVAAFSGVDCSVSNDTKFDWDNMDCQHGGRFFPPFEHPGWLRYCLCPPGWEGTECQICSTDLACGPNSYCDRTFNTIHSQKWFNCTGTDEGVNGIIIGEAQMTFSYDASAKTTLMKLYVRSTGVPLDFSCKTSQCTATTSQNTLTIDCLHTSCLCTTFCGNLLADYINLAATESTLKCDGNTGNCVWNQAELDYPFPFLCGISECIPSQN